MTDNEILQELRANDGAILCFQVSDVHAFDSALARGVIGYNVNSDCYTHPNTRIVPGTDGLGYYIPIGE